MLVHGVANEVGGGFNRSKTGRGRGGAKNQTYLRKSERQLHSLSVAGSPLLTRRRCRRFGGWLAGGGGRLAMFHAQGGGWEGCGEFKFRVCFLMLNHYGKIDKASRHTFLNLL